MKFINVLRLNQLPMSLIKVICWATSSLCKGDFEKCQPFLLCFKQLLEIADNDVISDTLWGLTYLTDNANEKDLEIIASKVPITFVIKYIAHPKVSVKSPALRALGNFCSGSSKITDDIMTHSSQGIMLNELKSSSSEKFITDLCWIISNLCLGPSSHIEKLLNEGLLKSMCDIINNEPPYKIKVHAAYALASATEEGTEKQLWKMIDMGVLECLTKIFYIGNPSPELLNTLIKGLDKKSLRKKTKR